jgi:hypothetical protein
VQPNPLALKAKDLVLETYLSLRSHREPYSRLKQTSIR